MPDGALRVGLATVWDGVPDYACAVRHWCQHAQNLGDLIVRAVPAVAAADLLMLLTDDHEYERTASVRTLNPHPWRPEPPVWYSLPTKRSFHSSPCAPQSELVRTSRGKKLVCKCQLMKKRFCPECYGGAHGEVERISAREVVRTDCPQLLTPALDPQLRDAVRRFADSPTGGCRSRWQTRMLYKWWALSLERYALVIVSDLDIQLLRPEQPVAHVEARWSSTWAEAAPEDGRTRVLAVGDYTSPFNGGLWTVGWPSRAMYRDGLAQLRRGLWNATHGFNLVGTPRQIYARSPALRERMERTRMFKHDTWGYAFGDCDQGFLFYMFYLRGRRGAASALEGGALQGGVNGAGGVAGPAADASAVVGGDFAAVPPNCTASRLRPTAAPDADPRCPHTARHYWGPRKPWQLEKDNAGRVAVFLEQTSFDHLPHANASLCAARFAGWAPRLAEAKTFLNDRVARNKSRTPKRNHGKLQRLR